MELESEAQSLRESDFRTQEKIRKGRKQCFSGRLTELHARDPVQTAKEKYILLLKDNHSTYLFSMAQKEPVFLRGGSAF